MYARDERAVLFSPAIPDFESSETKFWMFTVPGAHETLVAIYRQTDIIRTLTGVLATGFLSENV